VNKSFKHIDYSDAVAKKTLYGTVTGGVAVDAAVGWDWIG